MTMIVGKLGDKLFASRRFFCSSQMRSSSLPEVSGTNSNYPQASSKR